MDTSLPSSPPAVVVDANVLIALCAKGADKYTVAHAQMTQYAVGGWRFYAPGVIIAETLFVLCGKLQSELITPTEHLQAIQVLIAEMKSILPPPNGDASLIQRAEQIRGGYSCRRSADGLYIALAEELAQTGVAELVTFDADLQKQAAATSPIVRVRLLVPLHSQVHSDTPGDGGGDENGGGSLG